MRDVCINEILNNKNELWFNNKCKRAKKEMKLLFKLCKEILFEKPSHISQLYKLEKDF